MQQPILIGIGGTNGSGKDSLGQILADKHGFLFISMTDMLRNELQRRRVPTNRENMRELSAAWRRESGLGVLIDKAWAEYQKVAEHYRGLVVASLRNPGENDRVHELGGAVVWVDASPQIRYDRITSRGRIDDQRTFDEFLQDEQAEMHQSGDEATLNMAGVKAKADITIENNEQTIEAFEQLISKKLHDLLEQ